MQISFVVGYEYAPESYWRCLLPARALRAPALMIGEATGRHDDLVWIHEPLGERCERVIAETRAAGGLVVVDWSEDPWSRGELGEGVEVYTSAMLQAAERCVESADLVVCASAALADIFAGLPTVVVPPVVATVQPPASDVGADLLGWWSDGRQKMGFEQAAPYLRRAIEATSGRIWHVQYPHMAPLGLPVERQRYIMAGGDAERNLRHFQRYLAQVYLSLEPWPACSYTDTVSDLSILRSAALGVPTLSTRKQGPPGSLTAPVEDWSGLIEDLSRDPERRQELSRSAREWAAERIGFNHYKEIIARFDI